MPRLQRRFTTPPLARADIKGSGSWSISKCTAERARMFINVSITLEQTGSNAIAVSEEIAAPMKTVWSRVYPRPCSAVTFKVFKRRLCLEDGLTRLVPAGPQAERAM